MIILGMDFGLKKIGLAYSDETELVAAPYKTRYIKDIDDALTFLIQLKQQIKLEKQIQINLQEKLKIPVEFWDETYSTKIAEYQARGRKRANADSEAARIILQEYLDYQNERRKYG